MACLLTDAGLERQDRDKTLVKFLTETFIKEPSEWLCWSFTEPQQQEVMGPSGAGSGTYHRRREVAAWPFARLSSVSEPSLFQIALVATLLATVLGKCGTPPKLDFASPVKMVDQEDFNTGTVLKYTCHLGYSRKSSNLNMICRADGTWEYDEFCVKKRCQNPGDIRNGHVEVKTDFSFGSQIHFSCLEGYNLIGSTTSFCDIQDKGVDWSDPLPVCVSVMCEPPPVISNGKHSGGEEDIFTYGSSVTYSCDPNFSLIGNASISCSVVNKNTSVWKPDPPTCKKIVCQKPQIPKAILASGFKDFYIYKDTIMISCTNGFVLRGSSLIRCEANNQWFPSLPTCERSGCVNLPDIPFASWEGNTFTSKNVTKFGVGTHLKYQCKPGYRSISSDPQIVICQENLTWTFSGGCEKVCCPKPDLEKIRIISERRDLTHICFYTYGDYIFYMCDNGYIPVSIDGRSSCQADGKWAPKTPSCKSAWCPKPVIQNGKLSVTKDHYFELENVTVYCNAGYKMVGPYNIMCSDKNIWYPVVPKCVRVVLSGCEHVLAGEKLLQCLPQSEDVIKALQVYKLLLEIEQLQVAKDKWIKSYQTLSKNNGLLVPLNKYAKSVLSNFTHP
ncbi:zona pellucida sperm-binding protein 3 receptor-like isoform 2-T2 [Thomomys bottae]